MKRLILLASLAVLLLQEVHGASRDKVLMYTNGKDSLSEENINEQLNLGQKAIEQPEKDFISAASGPRSLEKNQDLLRQFRNPKQLPEEDRDFFYHPSSMDDVIETPKTLLERKIEHQLFHREVLQGPEEDRDHIYHADN